jgi:hypothetical protein
MERSDVSHLEEKLLDAFRSYVDLREAGTEDEQAAGLRDVCSTTARLLGQLLSMDERWNRFWWVDDVLPTSATLLPGQQLQLYGFMIWGQKGAAKEWFEPCSIVLSDAADALKYQIRCGDAQKGLGKLTYAHRRKIIREGHFPEDWEFVFSN